MREVVYLGHDNSIDYLLKENDSAVNLSTSTSMSITLGTVTISSTNGASAAIRWAQVGYSTGEVRLYLGLTTTIAAGDYDAPLIAYGPDYANGLVWGKIGIRVMSGVAS
jgi:hypothetical protein